MKDKIEHSIKEEKLKPLIPTLRTKKRFVKIKVNSKSKFDFKIISDKLTEEIMFYMGAIDFGKAGIWFLKDKFNYENQELIIRVGIKYKEKLLASLSLIDKINNHKIELHIVRVSGTLKGLEKK